MLGRCKMLNSRVAAHAVGCLLLCAGLAAQDLQTPSAPLPAAPVPARVTLSTRLQGQVEKRGSQEQLYLISACYSVSRFAKSPVPCESPRHITLEEAQAQARTVSSPMAHLAQLQVEAAREARLAAQSEYFPKVSSSFFNLHFNKLMGEEFVVQQPLLGGSATLALPLLGKNQTF